MEGMKLRLESQQNIVGDEVSAITAVVRPILLGVLLALKQDVVARVGGHEKITLSLLARLYRPGDGDCGICFEYAVHDAMRQRNPSVLNRVGDVLSKHCKINGDELGSILFAAEKAGVNRLIDTSIDLLTPQSVLMAGAAGRPVQLKRHLSRLAENLRRRKNPPKLPQSISGLWKADLFLGKHDSDRWVGTTVKINPSQLEAARGLRVGIVPARQGKSDLPRKDEQKNLVICPLAYDGEFMEIFYNGWSVIQQFIAADARLPKEVALPRPPQRQVAKYLEERREFPALEVVEALLPLSQPELLHTREHAPELVTTRPGEVEVSTVISPVPLSTS